tara:strand:+ start:123 stop:578 length:456 start_codon:yes stop_codon:yes gene_type:complete
MRTDKFVMRGQTASDHQEVLNFSGFKPGYAYRMTDLTIYPSVSIGTENAELLVSVTAAKTFEDPANPDFSNEGLIGVAMLGMRTDSNNGMFLDHVVLNDTFLITQNLILAAKDTYPGSPMAVNWQCTFMPVKMSKAEEAVTNYKQFLISDE